MLNYTFFTPSSTKQKSLSTRMIGLKVQDGKCGQLGRQQKKALRILLEYFVAEGLFPTACVGGELDPQLNDEKRTPFPETLPTSHRRK